MCLQDREEQVRFGAPPTPFLRGGARGGFAGAGRGGRFGAPVRGGHFGAPPLPYGAGGAIGAPTQLYVSNVSTVRARHGIPGRQLTRCHSQLPYEATWQDLKDLFRAAGNISRADINMGADGRPRGTGIVAFHNSNDASTAISMFHGYDFRGRNLEVRLDRFAHASAPGSYAQSGAYSGFAPSSGGTFAGYGPNVAPPSGYSGAASAYGAPRGPSAAPSQQIFVKNLPWSTSNDDLVELFQTVGQVTHAEIMYEGGRSKGTGVVQFATTSDAELAIAKFNSYVYGGRPLDINFNRRWHPFTPATGGVEQSYRPSDDTYATTAAAYGPTSYTPAVEP